MKWPQLPKNFWQKNKMFLDKTSLYKESENKLLSNMIQKQSYSWILVKI